jgi:hypothetical protein
MCGVCWCLQLTDFQDVLGCTCRCRSIASRRAWSFAIIPSALAKVRESRFNHSVAVSIILKTREIQASPGDPRIPRRTFFSGAQFGVAPRRRSGPRRVQLVRGEGRDVSS